MTTILLLLLLLSSAVYSDRLACTTSAQCIAAINTSSWCLRASLACVRGFCRQLPGVPCHSTIERCSDETRSCLAKTCRVSAECRSGLFCEAPVSCINRRCKIQGLTPCQKDGGVCLEANRTCMYPSIYGRWKNKTALSGSTPEKIATISSVKTHAPHAVVQGNTRVSKAELAKAMHWNSSNHTGRIENNEWIPWVVIGIACLIFFVLVVLMVAMATPRWTPVPVSNAVWQY